MRRGGQPYNDAGRGGRQQHHYNRSEAVYRRRENRDEDQRLLGEESRKRPKKVFRKKTERNPFFKKRKEYPRDAYQQTGGREDSPSPYYPSNPRQRERDTRREVEYHRHERHHHNHNEEEKEGELKQVEEEGTFYNKQEAEGEVAVVIEENGQDVSEEAEDGSVYNYGDHFQFDEDREHEFKSITHAINPIDRISLFCDVRLTFIQVIKYTLMLKRTT